MSDPADDEPRVRDLLQRREEAEAALAPTTQAQLRAWFGLPSFQELAEAGVVAPEAESDLAKRLKKRAETLSYIEPEMIGLLDRHTEASLRVRIPHPPGATRVEGRLTTFDDSAVHVPTEDDFREVEVPRALEDDLQICTPQAFLRDLARPETEFYVRFQPPWDDMLEEEVPLDAMASIRAAIRANYRAETTIERAVDSIQASITDLRALLARPWAEGKRERARQREAELLRKLGDPGDVVREPEGAS